MGMRNSKVTTVLTSAEGEDQKGLDLLGKLFLSLQKQNKTKTQMFFNSEFCTHECFWHYLLYFYTRLFFFSISLPVSFLTTPIRRVEEEKYETG